MTDHRDVLSGGEGSGEELDTLNGRDYPSIRQFSIFSPNRVGQLANLVARIERARLRICALAVVESSECAIIRLVVSEPERAYEILQQAGLNFVEVDLMVVELPDTSQPVVEICSALLQAELNIHYCFPLLTRPHGAPALGIYVDNLETAAKLLQDLGFTLLNEADLEEQ